jgi:integrase
MKILRPAKLLLSKRKSPDDGARGGEYGRPWTLNGFRSSFFQLIRKLEKKGQVEPGLTCHGLRHTAATRLREGGFHLQTIADFLGQDTQGMAAHYSRDADLKGEMRKVVEFIDLENGPGSKVSNKRKNSV